MPRSPPVQYLSGIQRGFLELLGAIQWITAWDDNLNMNLELVVGVKGYSVDGYQPLDKISDWDLCQNGGRGVPIDWREVNITLYVDNGVPVHYMWTNEFKLSP